jgi:hypothetical protein
MTEIQYVWEHWKFNADQRIKAFNFFVVFAIFVDGGLFAAIEKSAHPVVLAAIGSFIVALAAAFWVIDVRSERLIRLSEPGLRLFETGLSEEARIFHEDARQHRQSPIRYKNSFRTLFGIQIVFGLAVLAFGILAANDVVPRNLFAPLASFSSGPANNPAKLNNLAPAPAPAPAPRPGK